MQDRITRQEAEIKLKRIFGIDHFYDEQWRAIERIFRGERILMIERTGFGKSLCYQFPATQFDGVTVIFSPLIALMRDQVRSLCKRGIPAAYINSEQSYEENKVAIQRALNKDIKILYIAPERQENDEWIEATRKIKLSMVVIDEAHTISTWGHDFRPSFRRIINLVQLLPKHLPILATTATATKRVQQDIEAQIGGQLTTIRGNLVRPNFELQVITVQSEDEKMIWLAQNINSFTGTGLIYTGTRVDTEIYAKWLQFMGIKATDYNAGFDAETRKSIENGLMANQWKCVVSTNALGMGIDKPDIRFIIHTQIPVSPIHYYQEIGRAGRDGKPTRILLFYNKHKDNESGIAADSILPLSFIDGARPTTKKYQKVISLLQEEPLSEREVMKRANLKQNQARVIKADLIDQGIIKEVLYGRTKKYEYQYNAPELNTTYFEKLREAKLKDLHSMEQYIYTDIPRMKYLCAFLDSDEQTNYTNCDNTNLQKLQVSYSPILSTKLEEFRETYFPILELATWTIRKNGFRICIPSPNTILLEKTIIDENGSPTKYHVSEYHNSIKTSDYTYEEIEIIKEHLKRASRLVNGCAASYYGVSNIGAALHRSKYENGGDFPDFLLKKTLSVFGKKYKGVHFDLVMYLPPTKSGDLVKNFTTKFARVINVPISHDLIKIRITQEQKIFQNSYSKQENVAGAFDVDEAIVKGKTILLLDDIYDSGATLKEIGKLLTQKGAKYIVPIVIAKTVGGTL
jgi:ATP-dependent DNA helicase RecQ